MTETGTEYPPLDQPPGQRRRRQPLQRGEALVIGREPTDVTVITVNNGRALREIRTWELSMAECFEIIERALRERIDQPFKRETRR